MLHHVLLVPDILIGAAHNCSDPGSFDPGRRELPDLGPLTHVSAPLFGFIPNLHAYYSISSTVKARVKMMCGQYDFTARLVLGG